VEGIDIIAGTTTTQDFHNRRTQPPGGGNSFRGKKYNDLNGNGQKDPDEPGLPDSEYIALNSAWTYSRHPPPMVAKGKSRTIESRSSRKGINHRSVISSRGSSSMISTVMGSGSRAMANQVCPIGRSGWIRIMNGTPDQTTQTNNQGSFEFAGVSASTYTVGEEQQPDWIQTSPPTPGTFTFTIPGGPLPTVHFMMFGNRQTDLPTGQLDFGDAPVSYGNAWYSVNDNMTMGSTIDAENSPYFSSAADGDDNNNTDDEDGVTFQSSLAWGKTVEVCVEIYNNDSTAKEVTVAGWIDFDGNGI